MTVERPWMTAIEMQFAIARATDQSYGRNISVVPELLRRAETYAWTAETLVAILEASKTVPDTSTVSSVALPSTCGFWWFGQPHVCPIMALLWFMEPDNLFLSDFGGIERQNAVPPYYVDTLVWPLNRSIDRAIQNTQTIQTALTPVHESLTEAGIPPADLDLAKDVTQRIMARLFLAGCVWLQQRILVTSTGHIERHRRKQLAREHGIPPPADVKVVELRRRDSTAQEPSAGGAPVEWSCQWIVSGHWTHQAHGPKQGERRLQYILPYVKGPADKPLKVPKQTVYLVNR